MGPECRAHAASGGRVTRRGGGKTSETGEGRIRGAASAPDRKQVKKNKCSGKDQICTQCMCNTTPLAGMGCAPL